MLNQITEKSKIVVDFLKEHKGEELTNVDIAEALGMTAQGVTGTVTALAKRGYAERIEGPVVKENGKAKIVKYIQITPEGEAYDHDSAVAADEEEAVRVAAEKAAKKAAKEADAE